MIFSKMLMNPPLRFVCLLALLNVGTLALAPMVIAQTPPLKRSSTASTLRFNAPPASQGAPRGRRRGGAGRDTCRAYEGLTALVPDNGGVGGQTVSDRPKFWFYLPTPLTAKTAVRFTLQG
jgi:Domain of Unknown Function (DUF928)